MSDQSRPSIFGYTLTEELSVDRHTTVYRAVRDHDRESVVMKVLTPTYPNLNQLVRFRNQYFIAKNLVSPGIVTPLALVPWQHSYALVMEDVGGIALRDYLQTHNFTVEQVLVIALQMTDSLHYLSQRQVLHQDINPANILIHPDTHQIWLTDFSLASLLPKESQELKSPGALEGALAYIAPEQTGRMNRGIDYRADFYSLGVTLYELLTGELPFQSDDPMELIHCHIAKAPVPLEEVGSRKSEVGNPIQNSELRIPTSLARIVLKLMAKNAEDRYQSALGLRYDLQHCLDQWEASGQVKSFELGQRDQCDRFLIPEKIYGREAEVQTLLEAFERVSQGTSELMLVAGFSGIGKTAVVNEVYKPITRQKGYFIKGKFDQFNRNIPFSAFVQAFRSLMGQLLGESDAALADWRTKILTAVGESGRVLIEVIPELQHIIGEQPPVPELSGTAAQNRFNLLFGKFIRVFTTPAHPLVIFLDDLQWVDSASLNLFKLLMDDESGYLLVLGAYRNNEVFPAHPLRLMFDEIQELREKLNTLTLEPLRENDITHLVADTLHCSNASASPLAQLVYQKTQGNPFFATQFLQGLHGDNWITFNEEAGHWQYDLPQVSQLALTDDVVTFMVSRLRQLPNATQKILKLSACIGNHFDLQTLAVVCECSQAEAAVNLWPSLQMGLIVPTNNAYKFLQGDLDNIEPIDALTGGMKISYRFLHDCVQKSAYTLIPQDQRSQIHYHLGQLLTREISKASQETQIFELVSHLNHGAEYITVQNFRDNVAQHNLKACQKAKRAIAYQAGYEYAAMGLSWLGSGAWERQYDLSLQLSNFAAEFAWLCGDLETMDSYIQIILKQSQSLLDKIPSFCLQIQANTSQMRFTEALKTAQYVFKLLGVALPKTATFDNVPIMVSEIKQLLSETTIADLINLPLMEQESDVAVIQIISQVIPAAYICGSPLFAVVVILGVKLLVRAGNSPLSAYVYANYAYILCNYCQEIETGEEFGKLALRLANESTAKSVRPQVYVMLALYMQHRKSPLRETLDLARQGYIFAQEVGNQEWAGYSAYAFCANGFASAQNLKDLAKVTQDYCVGLVKLNQIAPANWCQIYRQAILNLTNPIPQQPQTFFDTPEQEANFLAGLHAAEDLLGLYHFHLCKLMISYLFGDIEAAHHHALEARARLDVAQGTVGLPVFYFYDSLTLLSQLTKVTLDSEEYAKKLQQVEQNQDNLQQNWARYAPVNYQHKFNLVEAEKLGLLGEWWAALELYDEAIEAAKNHGYIQEEALANELSAKFYLGLKKEKIAAIYMQAAYSGYAHWSAKAKIQNLKKRHPNLLQSIFPEAYYADPLETLESVVEFNLSTHSSIISKPSSINKQLDFAAVLKASQLISEKVELDELLTQLVQLMLHNSGADKLAIILPSHDHDWEIRAIATPETTHLLAETFADYSNLPTRFIQYVKNTQEIIAIDNLDTDLSIIDVYLQRYKPRSILCIPILHQGDLSGLLYLQNQSIAGVFSRDRILILNVLCSQAAIALENARLFKEQQQSAQELVLKQNHLEALLNNIPHIAWVKDSQSRFIAANEPLAQLLNSSPTEMIGKTDYDFSPAEIARSYQEDDFQVLTSGQRKVVEEKMRRGDGSWGWLETTKTPFYDAQGHLAGTVGIAADISDRKQAERVLSDYNRELEQQVEERTQALQENEERLRLAMSATNQGFFDVNLRTGATVVSPDYALMLGYDPTTFHETNETWQSRLHPDDREQTQQAYRAYASGQASQYKVEYRLQTQQGDWKWILSVGQFIEWDDAGRPTRLLGTHTDISDRKFAEIQLAAQNELLARIAQGQPLSEVLNTLIDHVEDSVDGALCAVMLLDKDNRLRFGAAPSLPAAYIQAADAVTIAEGVGSCGTAAFRNQTVIVADIATDPLWSAHKDLALRHCFRAGWSSPISVCGGQQVLGTFAIYYRQVRSPQSYELEVITQMAHIAGIAIERHQAEAQLRQSEATLLKAQQVAHVGNWEFDIASQTTTWSPEMFRIYGLEPTASAPSYPEFLKMLRGESRLQLQHYVERAIAEGTPYTIEYSRTRADGSVSHHECRAEVEQDDQGQTIRLFGTALDITDRKQAELALQNLVTGTAATIGEDFFPALVHHISTALEVPLALVTQFVDQELQSLAFIVDGELQPNFTYNLLDTPCRDLVVDYTYHCPSDLAEHFPNHPHRSRGVDSYLGVALRDRQGQVLGSLCIFDRQPLQDPERARQILNVFGSRAAAELERQRTEKALEKLIAGTAVTTRADFFPVLVRYLTEALGVSHALMAERTGDEEVALAYFGDGQLLPTQSFAFLNTPCEAVYERGSYYCELEPCQTTCAELNRMGARSYLGVALHDRQGTAIGLLSIFHHKVLPDPVHAEQILRVFAARAATELERQRAENALQNLIAGTAALTGPDFFTALVRYIAEALNASHAFVTEVLEGDQLRFLAAWGDGQHLPTDIVAIEGTTCALALRKGAYHCERDVIACFPQNPRLAPMGVESYMGVALQNSQGQALGTLCIFSRQLIANPEHSQEILRVFAARAAAELERQRAEQAMEQLNRELEIRVRDRTAQLAASEDRLKTLFNQAADAVFLLGEQGFIDCNQAAVALLRYASKDELLALQPHQISPERQPDGQLSVVKAQFMLQEALQRCSCRFEWIHQRANGENFWAEITLTPISYQEEMIFHCITRDISDRKRLEQEQARLTAVLEATPDFIGIANAQGEILWHNKPLRELRADLGNPDEHRSINACHPDWVNKIIRDEALPTAMQQGSWSGELALLDDEGNEIPVSQVIIAHKSASGEVETFSTIMRDIRAIKQTEAALKLSEAQAQATFTQAAVGFAESDLQTRKFIRVNDCFCTMLGYTSAELADMTVRDITHPDDISTSVEAIKQLHSGEIDSLNLEKRYIRKDGTIFWAETTAYLIKIQGGETISRVGLIQDVSEKKRLEAERQDAALALQLSEARANAAFEQAAVGIAESNLTDGKITRTNNYFCQMTGYTAQELESLTAADLTYSDDLSDSRYQIKQLYTGKIDSFTIEKRYLRKDGSHFWASTAVTLIHNPAEDSPRCLAVVQDISDRKAAEQQLQQLSERLELAIESAQIGIWDWHGDNNRLSWDERMFEIYGVHPEEFEGTCQDWENRVHPEDLAQYEAGKHIRTPNNVKDYSQEFRIIRSDGTIRYILATAFIERDTQGHPIRMVGTNLDITRRKAIELALQESERRFASLAAAAPVAILRFDSECNCIYVNERWCEITGRPAASALGQGWLDAIHPEEMDSVLAALDRTSHQDFLETQILQPGESRHLRPDGKVTWCYSHIVPEFDGTGNLTGYIGTLTDITERKEAELALQDAQARFRRMTENVPGMIFRYVLHADGGDELTYVDSQVREIFEVEPEAAFQDVNALWERIHPDDSAQVSVKVRASAESLQPFTSEHRLLLPQKGLRWIQLFSRPERLNNGDVIWDGVVIDISDRKQAEEQLQQTLVQLEASNNELESFAYSVSHDLRAPLRAINGFSQALLEDYGHLFDEQGQDYFARIRSNTNRMSQLIDDLLRLSRLSRSELRYTRVDLSVIAQEVLHDLYASEPDRQVEMIVKPGEVVVADSALMRVVLMNLLQNAWKFTRHHATARIEFGVLPPDTSVSSAPTYFVRDDGAGFDMTYSHKLFGVFQRLHSFNEFPGTGIGLASVRRAIHRHGGQVWAEASVEQGATIFFTIPPHPEDTLLKP